MSWVMFGQCLCAAEVSPLIVVVDVIYLRMRRKKSRGIARDLLVIHRYVLNREGLSLWKTLLSLIEWSGFHLVHLFTLNVSCTLTITRINCKLHVSLDYERFGDGLSSSCIFYQCACSLFKIRVNIFMTCWGFRNSWASFVDVVQFVGWITICRYVWLASFAFGRA